MQCLRELRRLLCTGEDLGRIVVSRIDIRGGLKLARVFLTKSNAPSAVRGESMFSMRA